MQILDIVILLLLAASAVMGFISGAVRQLGTITGLVVGILACRSFGMQVAVWFAPAGQAPDSMTVVLSNVGIFLVVFLAVKLVAMLVHKVVHTLQLGIIDRLAGAVLKTAVCLFLVSLALNVWCAVSPDPLPTPLSRSIKEIAPAAIDLYQAQPGQTNAHANALFFSDEIPFA